MVLLAQISDLHLDGTARAIERADRVMDHLRALPRAVDAVLVTGDIADRGDPAEYRQAAEILTCESPVLVCPGNHDERRAFRSGLLGKLGAPLGAAAESAARDTESAPINQLHRIGDAAIVLLDSTIPGSPDGLLTPDTLDWLTSTLDDLGGTVPVLLALHHPPVDLHHPLPDRYPLRRREDLAEVLAGRPEVVAILGGHAHTAATSMFAARPVILAPAVTWTLRMPWEGDSPVDLAAPPALAFHVLEDWRLTTHFRILASPASERGRVGSAGRRDQAP
ncbi:metallophosphoesterase [Actinoalloteichus hymeniacidonis]|uniref:Calcineurin-like phosphoesterase n=1 Tax=Actinoalloteichus hymeniacidonis TaxID=340345 RepID=A0AAC9HSH6_9PSEU|nr:metallophosphoesterase [Actinoalloteichus hymeniacidonis]AOS64759.1 Calcineurin-like phosphoesterase [Actinoalloteichus hymeniacidonis]MBB5907165.1 3',5'-cyclic AMP phosphodiesterase CpdA [Actinoalloteichus hymeniacidonis]